MNYSGFKASSVRGKPASHKVAAIDEGEDCWEGSRMVRKETDLERRKVFGQVAGADVRSGAAELATSGLRLPDSPVFHVSQTCGQVQGQ